MEDADVDRPLTTISSAKSSRRSGRVRVVRQSKTSTFNDLQSHARIRERIAQLLRSRRVAERVIPETWESAGFPIPWKGQPLQIQYVGTETDVAEMWALQEQRRALELKIGPDRLTCGMPHHFHHNGIGYVIHPYQRWLPEYMQLFGCFLQIEGRWLSTRDSIIWYLWNFRDRALILTGPLSSKVRFFTRECVNCQRRYSPFGPHRSEKEPLGCPSCGHGGMRDITPEVKPRPFGTITKIALRNRFRISERKLGWILSAKPARFPDQTPST